MITLSNLTRTLQNYALDASASDEAFLNALLAPLVSAGRVKARGGKDFALDKSRTSNLLSGKHDVPGALRKALSRYGIEDFVAEGFTVFIEENIDASLFEPLSKDVLGLAANQPEIERKLRDASSNPERFMAIALLEAVKNDNRESYEQPIWDYGTGSLSVEVGDIFAGAFGKPRNMKHIVVVPVETTFETRVTWGYEDMPAPLISPRTLHGKWLRRMGDAGIDADELDDRIASSLRRRSISPVSDNVHEGNGRVEYPLGAVAVIPNARSIFYLLAIARLDEHNNASATRDDITHSLRSLFEMYDKDGQGLDLYIPLLGTGESRAGLTHQESLDLIMDEAKRNMELIHGKVTIVVYREDANKLTIQTGEQ